jgi:hypothetical protein
VDPNGKYYTVTGETLFGALGELLGTPPDGARVRASELLNQGWIILVSREGQLRRVYSRDKRTPSRITDSTLAPLRTLLNLPPTMDIEVNWSPGFRENTETVNLAQLLGRVAAPPRPRRLRA